ncbi:SusC/RagA family TonB-linked outer membrane protein [Chitinophaga sp.]|uniref:SusC/RagA family TonB-linked outer membrane protein n=1 Tax=Chitinophaga sp. TaxID=1869181 RepID=UPI00262CD175|nr:SusC/RagA family TonB-linked outer membrane protein [uncultured Chitinophaga sp.]
MKKALLFLAMLMVSGSLAYAQQRQITGRVTGEDGSPIPYASIQIKGTTKGTTADQFGNYKIQVSEKDVLLIRSVGYNTLEKAVGAAANLPVILILDSRSLQEVVITTAMGIQRQAKSVGYSVGKVKSADLVTAKATTVASSLVAKVSGLQVNTINNSANPQTRIILRGNRSLTGQNQALIVLDGVEIPNSQFNSINPEDVEDVNVLKGANASALYGSRASNGAIVITTKRAQKGRPVVSLSNSTQFEEISFFPSLQDKFGTGSTKSPIPVYNAFENQQYGPAYDGSEVEIGKPLEDGSVQKVKYSPNRDRYNFWNTGLTLQNNLSVSTADDKSTFYASIQNQKVNGVVPKDKFGRNGLRVNASRTFGKVTASTNISYTQNTADIHTNGGGLEESVYWMVMNTAAHVPLTSYKNWKTDKFSNPNGYYNEYYYNPYFIIDQFRTDSKTDNLIGNFTLSYKPMEWLSLMGRVSTSTQNSFWQDRADKFTYTPYTTEISSSKVKAEITNGFFQDNTANYVLNQYDFMATAQKTFNDFDLRVVLGNNIRQERGGMNFIRANALVNPGFFNVDNRVGELEGENEKTIIREHSQYIDASLGYKDFAFIHGSYRRDHISRLSKKNRNFGYPGVDVSFVASEALPFLKGNRTLNYLKLFAGYSEVGQANIGPHMLDEIYVRGDGFPFGSTVGFTLGNTAVSDDLRPERVKSKEAGVEMGFVDGRISLQFTYYDQLSLDQTITAGLSNSTGYSGYLINSGKVSNKGYEIDLKLLPLRSADFRWEIGVNYANRDNKVIEISADLPELALTTAAGNAYVAAIPGQPYPMLKSTVYEKYNGKIIVDAETGMPSRASGYFLVGNTNPRHIVGLNTNFQWKNLRFTALAEHRSGYSVYHDIGSDLDFTGASAVSASYNRERFIFPNSVYESPAGSGKYVDNNNVLVMDGNYDFWPESAYRTSIGENYVTSGSFWKLREVSLSYDLPETLLARIKFIKRVSIGLTGRNLVTWLPKSNQYTDPEFNFTAGNAVGMNDYRQTPPTRMYGFNVSVNF